MSDYWNPNDPRDAREGDEWFSKALNKTARVNAEGRFVITSKGHYQGTVLGPCNLWSAEELADWEYRPF